MTMHSESMYRFIVEHCSDAIWLMDIASGRPLYLSPSVSRLCGFTSEECMAQPIEAGLTPESAERFRSILGEAIGRWNAGDRSEPLPMIALDHRHKDGHVVSTEVLSTLHPNAAGEPVWLLGVERNVTERKQSEHELQRLAFHDPLTDLPNRRLMIDRLRQMIVRAKRDQTQIALLFIDLDKFKPINDDCGHAVGDWLLQSVAKRIQACLRESDTAARIGGDEFVVLLPDVNTSADALAAAEKIRLTLELSFVTNDGIALAISSSIGIALYPEHAQTEQNLLRVGDQAMYRAKMGGRNSIELFALEAPLDDFRDIG